MHVNTSQQQKSETTKWKQKPPEEEKYIKQEKTQYGTLTQLMKQM